MGEFILFGFHHAGGSIAAFSGWQRALGPQVEVVPVALPGRGRDGRSPRYRDLDTLVEALAQDLGSGLSGRHVLYGHSMGALVAYRLTRLLARRAQRLPEKLIVGAFGAPHLRQSTGATEDMTDSELLRWLVDTSDIHADLLGGTERLAVMLARLREDLRIIRPRRPAQDIEAPLPCPIHVFTGTRDPLVDRAAAAGWSRHTSAGCTVHAIPGGHFFPRESKRDFFGELRSVLHGESALTPNVYG
ncbi:thioesterase II family protein [Streptomyces sp. V4I2]|uniref:thioesterase II family protein n=1 Tax=Streptomyces sp. V4I2 TaxID=3042280 RepID=UPI002785F6C5|nr:alpha/beta fold hydrolase [Streptomyces sp. V4I2]MDQ1047460.1 surfactin synthase thioesterase subunit [Streptomyces sp. V4I2]